MIIIAYFSMALRLKLFISYCLHLIHFYHCSGRGPTFIKEIDPFARILNKEI